MNTYIKIILQLLSPAMFCSMADVTSFRPSWTTFGLLLFLGLIALFVISGKEGSLYTAYSEWNYIIWAFATLKYCLHFSQRFQLLKLNIKKLLLDSLQYLHIVLSTTHRKKYLFQSIARLFMLYGMIIKTIPLNVCSCACFIHVNEFITI